MFRREETCQLAKKFRGEFGGRSHLAMARHKRYCENVTSSIDERTETCPIRRRRRSRVSPPRAALTRLAEPPRRRRARCGGGGHLAATKKQRAGAAAPPAARARGLPRHWAAGGGVSRAAPPAASRLTPAARACRHARVSREPPRRYGRCMSGRERDRWSRRARRPWSARRGPRAARACASRAPRGATPSPSTRCWRRGRATSRCRRCWRRAHCRRRHTCRPRWPQPPHCPRLARCWSRRRRPTHRCRPTTTESSTIPRSPSRARTSGRSSTSWAPRWWSPRVAGQYGRCRCSLPVTVIALFSYVVLVLCVIQITN